MLIKSMIESVSLKQRQPCTKQRHWMFNVFLFFVSQYNRRVEDEMWYFDIERNEVQDKLESSVCNLPLVLYIPLISLDISINKSNSLLAAALCIQLLNFIAVV